MEFAPAQDRLFHNNGDGTFTDVTDMLEYEKLLGAGFTVSFVDYDNDGDLDIYVVNDSFMNPPDWAMCSGATMVPAAAAGAGSTQVKSPGAGIIIEGMGLAVGDYDNDLDLDFYFPNMVNPSALMQNQGDGTFVNAAGDAGVEVGPSAAVGWGDLLLRLRQRRLARPDSGRHRVPQLGCGPAARRYAFPPCQFPFPQQRRRYVHRGHAGELDREPLSQHGRRLFRLRCRWMGRLCDRRLEHGLQALPQPGQRGARTTIG